MAKFSYLSENKRYKIIHLKEEGYSMRQIAAKVPCGLSTVVRTLKRFSETNFIADRGRSGRPRKTSLREDSDESQFCISGNQSSAYVRRCTHEEFSLQCLKPTVKFPTKVMVWGCMSSHGVGRLHIVKTMDYIEILQNKLLPTARDLFGNQSWIFQDDNAPCHRAKVVQKWLKDHTVNRMDWPGQSPDLNPIENLWFKIGYGISKKKPSNKRELIEKL
ncbi:transposable element Tcb1 transposase [Trichonephila clavipes]|nr:transposable element Tcb1 transposase [Trichonephila clavipes]